MKAKFKKGDCIAPGGAPSELVKITDIETRDGVRFYVTESPEGHTGSIPVSEQQYYSRNKRAYSRQVDSIERANSPKDRDFDDDGFPTHESEFN